MTVVNIVKLSSNCWIVEFSGLEIGRYFEVETALEHAVKALKEGHGPLVINMVGCGAHEIDHVWDWPSHGVILTYDTGAAERSATITSEKSLVYIAPEGVIEFPVKGLTDCYATCALICRKHPELKIYVELGGKKSLPMDLDRFRSFVDYFISVK